MIGIPDWSKEPMSDLEAIAKSQLMIDAELAGPHLLPLVIDLDPSIHSTGQKCGDRRCPCAGDPTFKDRATAPLSNGLRPFSILK